jgi:hypothetical protein
MTNGYPTAAAGIFAAVRFDTATFSTASGAFWVTNAGDTANCRFTYADAASATTPPVTSAILNRTLC